MSETDRTPFPASAGVRRWGVVQSPSGERVVRPAWYVGEIGEAQELPGDHFDGWATVMTFTLPKRHPGLSPAVVAEAIR